MAWKERINPEERDAYAVFEALDDREWSWRTPAGISQSTGLPVERVDDVLRKYLNLIRVSKSDSRGPIYQLIERSEPAEERFIEKALDYFSMGRRRIA